MNQKKSSGHPFSQLKTAIAQKIKNDKKEKKPRSDRYVLTGIPGLDELFDLGIPKGSTVLVAGGPGSGKTIFCLQSLYHAALAGEKVLYMTLEESPENLKAHMADFGWDSRVFDNDTFRIKKFSSQDIARQIDAMIEKQQGELLIDLKPLLIPENFKPDRIVIDSLSAVSAALTNKNESYRVYIEQLFTIFNDIGATSFLICETPDPTTRISSFGVEEFLSDGVLLFYNVRQGNVRESAFEILKMRGSGFKKKIVAMQIKEKQGIVIYPDQEIFATV